MSKEPSGSAVGFTVFAGAMMILIGSFHADRRDCRAIHQGRLLRGDAELHPRVRFDHVGMDQPDRWHRRPASRLLRVQGFSVGAHGGGAGRRHQRDRELRVDYPIYPIWSLIIIAIDVAVIWALTAHGRDVTM